MIILATKKRIMIYNSQPEAILTVKINPPENHEVLSFRKIRNTIIMPYYLRNHREDNNRLCHANHVHLSDTLLFPASRHS
jgi:hypothetical protein